jgi:diaminopimelate decarboxylase
MKQLPFTQEQLQEIIKEYPTPFHIYDEKGIKNTVSNFANAFSWNKGFKEFYAIKACPNPFIMKMLKDEGCGIDCSSLAELAFAERVGMKGEQIMFSSNDTAAEEYQKAFQLGAIINLDDISHIAYLEKHAGIPEKICFRYNPGPLKAGNAIIGHPEESKYGLTHDQMIEAYKIMKEKGVKRFGIHTNVASNELGNQYFIETAKILFELII